MSRQLSIPGMVLGLQGAVNTVFAIYGLIQPTAWNAQMNDQFDSSIPKIVTYTISLQLLNMGIFSVLAATRPSLHRSGLIARVFVHSLTACIFWMEDTGKMQGAAMLDLGFAAISAIALPFVKRGGTP